MHGQPKYGPDFQHFDYVNPNAPKGGTIRLGVPGTFDTFNGFIPKGNAGGGTSWTMSVIATTGSHNIRAADIDRDGDIDIVGANWESGPIELWRGAFRN